MPRAFTGTKLDGAEVDTWIFSMNLYFAALNVPPERRALRAALNLEAEAAIWLRVQPFDLGAVTWDQLSEALRTAFRPADWMQRACD